MPQVEFLVTLRKGMKMNIEASKIKLVKMILNIDNDMFIKKVTDFITNEESDFWSELTPSEQAEIKEGIDQLNQGKRTSYKEVLKKIS